ncbi:hypothetical protein [Arthrobacter sp. ZGTC131]|uniref:hypothetical protein n=1 Tax=Arthrobacter sp. ZGTC131 TaxID=2058898 RepID=UPI000CE4CDE8|nr:hypothetical protein [Arthrobacter sp. ZGTC131]
MASDDHPTPERREITVRRAPKYVPFLILGGIVGIAAAAVIAYALPGDASYDRGAVFGFFMVLCGAGGVILGAIAALVLDRLSVKRAQHAVVEAAPETEQALPDAEPDTSRERTRDDGGEPGLGS